MNQMLKLLDKDFKTVMIKTFQQTITHSPETSEKMENLSIEKQEEITELKKCSKKF